MVVVVVVVILLVVTGEKQSQLLVPRLGLEFDNNYDTGTTTVNKSMGFDPNAINLLCFKNEEKCDCRAHPSLVTGLV